MNQDRIAAHFQSSLDGLTRAVQSNELLATTHTIAGAVADALKSGNKLLLIGNGGSAADAQHIAAEIVGRYKQERLGWAAIALTTDTSALTAIANDYGFEQIFARQVQGLAHRGDVLFALTTSGRSPNILAALKTARNLGVTTVGFTGTKGESLRASCDHLFVSPSDDTPVIQQIHMMAMHAICDAVEHMLIDATKAK
ncbi:D-sedoheptulose 7-phosphate isomerase [Bradyrhizobium sp. G127]|uniref:D-sedoheptulose 7-phosphate isomerase n=1 Tax=Bradyrhizobium sp. G127 TaxID=2904800 RepID=UPI001F2F6396|nr:D-sedoheptulose 7-phosphate isomerase [Bradyrhizobium sp. G127]MCF2524477.1 D-sedoheptulose 7-phosphate isomerase [Bradyrhizobium sp. G127]